MKIYQERTVEVNLSQEVRNALKNVDYNFIRDHFLSNMEGKDTREGKNSYYFPSINFKNKNGEIEVLVSAQINYPLWKNRHDRGIPDETPIDTEDVDYVLEYEALEVNISMPDQIYGKNDSLDVDSLIDVLKSLGGEDTKVLDKYRILF